MMDDLNDTALVNCMVERQNYKSIMDDYLRFCQHFQTCFVFSVRVKKMFIVQVHI